MPTRLPDDMPANTRPGMTRRAFLRSLTPRALALAATTAIARFTALDELETRLWLSCQRTTAPHPA